MARGGLQRDSPADPGARVWPWRRIRKEGKRRTRTSPRRRKNLYEGESGGEDLDAGEGDGRRRRRHGSCVLLAEEEERERKEHFSENPLEF